MRLINCKIVNFGCLSDCSFKFDEGLNLLYAENGKGKSTFVAFLKAMLYGLPSNRKAGPENERRRYMPWQGGTFGGALCFEAEGTEYRLERFFGARERDDRFALYHTATGNPSDRYGENIGEELFGVDADGFERSLFISQSAPFLPPDNNSIRARLGALLDASDDLGSFEKADELLDTARRHYRAQGERGFIPELSLAILDKQEELRHAEAAGAEAVTLAAERAAIEEKKQEVGAALAEAKEKRAQAEKRRLWDEQNASYLSLLDQRDAAKRQLAPLEVFFAPHMPTEEEMRQADDAATSITALCAQIESAVLPKEDLTTLSALEARYGASAPDEATVESVRTALSEWRSAKERVRAALSRTEAEKDEILLRFDTHTPSEGEVAAIRAAKDALQETQNLLYGSEIPQKKSQTPLLLGVLCGLLASLSVVSFLLSLLAVAIPSLLGALFSLGVLVYGMVRAARPPRELQSRLEEHRAKQRRLSFLLSAFGYTHKDPLFSATRFFVDLERYSVLLLEEKKLSDHLARCRAEEEEKRRALSLLLGRPDCTDPEAEANHMLTDVPVFRLLLQKRASLAERQKTLTKEREIASSRVVNFLSFFPTLADLSPRAALDTVKQNMILSGQLLAAYNMARTRVANYLQNTRFDPEAPPPPYEGDFRTLAETENTLQKAYTELEALSSVKESDRKRAEEIALTAPALLAEKERLDCEKKEAEHTLSLILTAKEILKDAKDDLATRYLRDMELHFDRYYEKLTKDISAELPPDGKRTTLFSMDTSLALSVEAYGERRPVAVLSRGERDLVAFCARLSLLEAIFTAEPPILFLDDPFINLDDANYAKATSLLAFLAERFQIIYTICSTSRLPAELPLKSL